MHSSASARPASRPPARVDAGIDHSRAVRERVHGDVQLVGACSTSASASCQARSFMPRSVRLHLELVAQHRLEQVGDRSGGNRSAPRRPPIESARSCTSRPALSAAASRERSLPGDDRNAWAPRAEAPHHLANAGGDVSHLRARHVIGDVAVMSRSPSISRSAQTIRASRAPASGRLRPRPSGVSHV